MLRKLLPDFGFGSQGFSRACLYPNYEHRKNRLNCLVTGGTRGIGQAVVQYLAGKGHQVLFTGRSKSVLGQICELSEPESVGKFVETISHGLDALILNAGGMPDQYSVNSLGEEIIFASQIKGHCLLLNLLLKKDLLNPGCRIVWVSSAGMYFKPLDIEMFQGPVKSYQKHTVYANVKRAQVILAEILAQQLSPKGFLCASMHPGWVDTPGVQGAMPIFSWLYKNRLRTAEQGADTILWMVLNQHGFEPGLFYFDRKPVKTHILNFTRESAQDRQFLYDISMV